MTGTYSFRLSCTLILSRPLLDWKMLPELLTSENRCIYTPGINLREPQNRFEFKTVKLVLQGVNEVQMFDYILGGVLPIEPPIAIPAIDDDASTVANPELEKVHLLEGDMVADP